MTAKITLIVALFFSALTFGQSKDKEIESVIINGNQKTIKYTDGSQSVSIVKKNPNTNYTKKYPFKSKQDEIAYLKKYISQIETKIQYVKNNPEEDKLAKEKGWYDDMSKYIMESKARIKEIEDILKTKEK
jgi:hypothetical protein